MRSYRTGKATLPAGQSIIVVFVFLVLTLSASAAVQVERGVGQTVSGQAIFSWARTNGGEVVEAGITIPLAIIENPPTRKGSGPAGAVAVLDFPPIVQQTTFLNHFELQWEKEGHEPPVFMVPHFDFHFYGVSPEAVLKVAAPDPSPPPAERIPAGFTYPGAEYTVPQMGVHAFRPADLEKPFTDVLIFGYYGGQMTFIEPMVTQETLLKQKPINYVVPVPASIGNSTRFPKQFKIEYDPASGACHLKFSDFVTTAP